MLLRKKIFGFLICFAPLVSLTSYGKTAIEKAYDECIAITTGDQAAPVPPMVAYCTGEFYFVTPDSDTQEVSKFKNLLMETTQKGSKGVADMTLMTSDGFATQDCHIKNVWKTSVTGNIPVHMNRCEDMNAAFIQAECKKEIQSACSSEFAKFDPSIDAVSSESFEKGSKSEQNSSPCTEAELTDTYDSCDYLNKQEVEVLVEKDVCAKEVEEEVCAKEVEEEVCAKEVEEEVCAVEQVQQVQQVQQLEKAE